MRLFLAAILLTALTGAAHAACDCRCVDGRIDKACNRKQAARCAADACAAKESSEQSSTQSSKPSSEATSQPVIPVSPAEITTTFPPSITSPDQTSPKPFPPSAVPPRQRADAPAELAPTAQGRRPPIQTTTPSTINRPDIPTAMPPNDRQLCYERQVFNPNTFEYEWQQSCN
jgi:hypothetical protein